MNEFKISRKLVLLSPEGLSLPESALNPVSGVDGDIYYNNISGQIMLHRAGSWTYLPYGININPGNAGQIPVYDSSGTVLSSAYIQNSQSIALQYTSQPTRITNLTYSLPNPGDSVSNTMVLLSDGPDSNLAVISKTLSIYSPPSGGVLLSTDTIVGAFFKLDSADQLRVLKSGDDMTGNLRFASGFGLGTTTAGSTLNIGTDGNTSVINIGNAFSVINILGSVEYVQSTNTQIEDSLITLNKGGSAGSGAGSGFEIEEGGSITGYFKVRLDRLGFELLAPASLGTFSLINPTAAFDGSLSASSISASRSWALPDSSGNIALISGSSVQAANAALSNLVSVAINTSLLPGVNNSIDVGSASFTFANVHSHTLKLYGATSGILTQSAAAATVAYGITWPSVQGAVGSSLFNDGSGNLTWDFQAAAALIKVDLHDPVDSTLPTGTITIDGFPVSAGLKVIFTNLLSGNNRVYQAVGTGFSITGWSLQNNEFGGLPDPSNGDTIVVANGTAYGNQIGRFYNGLWTFNDKVRYFNGTDYWEQSNIITSTLTNNTVNGTVYSVSFLGSEHQIVDYSVIRGTTRETGTIYITTDSSSTVNVTTSGAYIGSSGITFSGVISGSNVVLRYTANNSGSNATMKYTIKRWSDGIGGPAGPPSYTGFTGSTAVAAGPNYSLQYNNGGTIDGNANFEVDLTDLSLNLNGLRQTVLSSAYTLADNISTPTTLFSYLNSYRYAIIEYSVDRNGFKRVGRLLVSNDGSAITVSDDYVETGLTGTVFSAVLSGPNVNIQFMTSATGNNGVFKYSMRKWS